MATVTPSSRHAHFDRAATDRRVRHPLQAIRGHIRRYVLQEGLYVTVLYLAACFWLWLMVDYLPWKLFSFDWIWELRNTAGVGTTIAMRALLLTFALIGLVLLVYFKVARRMFREFNDSSVALLLERRYPRELGDRLITAVELADPELSRKYGYSQAMVDRTIQEAAEQVEKLPVHSVFRWSRLRMLLLLGLAGTAGAYLLLGIAYSAFSFTPPRYYFHRFNQTAGIWAERNLLMHSSYWPPHTVIELVRFPETGDLRVPKEDVRPDVLARVVKWAVPDSDSNVAPRGWRALRVKDLEQLLPEAYNALSLADSWPDWIVDLDDLPPEFPSGVIPPSWKWQGQTSGFVQQDALKREHELARLAGSPSARDWVHHMLRWKTWTVDRLEQQIKDRDPQALKKAQELAVCGAAALPITVEQRAYPVANRMKSTDPAAYKAFLDLFDQLEEMAENPAMGRTVRKLETPSKVIANRKSSDSRGTTACTDQGNGKFQFPLADLKESCQFSIAAGDYATAWREIELVSPPELERLYIDKAEPAYIFYRTLGQPDFLKNKWQETRSLSLGLTGPFSKVLVPAGTQMVLHADVDRAIKKVTLREVTDPKKRQQSNSEKPDHYVITGSSGNKNYMLSAHGDFYDEQNQAATVQSIHVNLGYVNKPLEFLLEYQDGAFVRGTRHIVIVPQFDQPPALRDLKLAVNPRTDTSEDPFIAGKCYLITPAAFLKLRGVVEDDRGLTSIRYHWEVKQLAFQRFGARDKDTPPTSTQPGGTEEPAPTARRDMEAICAGLQFMPGPGGESNGYFAAFYYAGLTQLYNIQQRKAFYASGEMDLTRASTLLTLPNASDVTPEEIVRLLPLPRDHRPWMVELLTVDTDTKFKRFVDRLKAAKVAAVFAYEVAGFLGLPERARNELYEKALTDPAAVLAALREPYLGRRNSYKAVNDRELLSRQPSQALVKSYNLQSEDMVNGFDLQILRRLLKRVSGGGPEAHIGLRLSLAYTDNNLMSWLGPTTVTSDLPYPFVLISENELISLMLRDQKGYHTDLKNVVNKLEEDRDKLVRQLNNFKTEGNPFLILGPMDKAKQSIVEGNDKVRQVREAFEDMLKEMLLNRLQEERINNTQKNIIMPLRNITAADVGGFSLSLGAAQRAIKVLQPDAVKWEKNDIQPKDNSPVKQALDANRPKHVGNAKALVDELNSLIQEIRAVMLRIEELTRPDELLAIATRMYELQQMMSERMRVFYQAYVDWLLNDTGAGKQ